MKIYTIEQDDDPYCAPYLSDIFWSLPDAIKVLKLYDSGVRPFITMWESSPNGYFFRSQYTKDGKTWTEDDPGSSR